MTNWTGANSLKFRIFFPQRLHPWIGKISHSVLLLATAMESALVSGIQCYPPGIPEALYFRTFKNTRHKLLGIAIIGVHSKLSVFITFMDEHQHWHPNSYHVLSYHVHGNHQHCHRRTRRRRYLRPCLRPCGLAFRQLVPGLIGHL